jgi:hypothetical protein
LEKYVFKPIAMQQKVKTKFEKGSNDSIAEYCIIAEVRKSTKKSLKKKVLKKVENCHSNA